jgi:hypothetical protein
VSAGSASIRNRLQLIALCLEALDLIFVPSSAARGGGKRAAARARALRASTSRSRGGVLATSKSSNSCAASATRSTARPKAGSLAFEGRVKPQSLRTNWSEAARISSSVAGGWKLCRVLMLRHMRSPGNGGTSSTGARPMPCTRSEKVALMAATIK